jgi:hypothetical protein
MFAKAFLILGSAIEKKARIIVIAHPIAKVVSVVEYHLNRLGSTI